MQYFGGKTKLAKQIVSAIKEHSSASVVYEPFCGACSVTCALASAGYKVKASDNSDCVIAMWQEAIGGRVMPYTVTEQQYKEAKTSTDKAYKGFVAHACSFGGKWFAGYARGNQDYCFLGSQLVFTRARAMKGAVEFQAVDYKSIAPESGSAIYCDPPYAYTTSGYSTSFDNTAFSEFLNSNWYDCDVFVSEYESPGESFAKVTSFASRGRLLTKDNGGNTREDNLYFRPARNH